MMFLTKYKNTLIALVIIVALFAAYKIFFAGDAADDELLAPTSIAEGDDRSELLTTLLELKSLTLDESLFTSNAFRSLRDFSQRLVPEPVGRRNPFAPIGGE